MSKINVLAVTNGEPITTKIALRSLLRNAPSSVKFLPADNPTPGTEAFRNTADAIPFGIPVKVHTGRTVAEVERRFDGKIVVR